MDSEVSAALRYSRAANLTAPKIAAQTSGSQVEGYWLTDSVFYFLAERMDLSLARVVRNPSLFDCGT